MIMAVLGLLFFGIAIGPVAVLLASMSLSRMRAQGKSKGKTLAVFALVLGVLDIVIWTMLILLVLKPGTPSPWSVPMIEPGAGSPVMEDARGPIQRAMKDNVIVEVYRRGGLSITREVIARGSGIIIGEDQSGALILTSRHLVSKGSSNNSAALLEKTSDIRIIFIDNTYSPVKVAWTPRRDIDLAVLSDSPSPENIPLNKDRAFESYNPGDKVFVVGNPLGLDWTYTQGVISATRKAFVDGEAISIIQTQAPVNTGNSGGGLYLSDGTLIGVITWARPKRISEGIGLAISYVDFLRLYRSSKKQNQRQDLIGPGSR
jgi:serine protease Do